MVQQHLETQHRLQIINLAADQHVFSINGTATDILLMDNVAKSHLVDEDLSDEALRDEAFPKNVGFRMSLEGTAERDNIFLFVQPPAKLVETPIVDGVVNIQEAVN